MLAGMNAVSNSTLCSAVSLAGGIGSIGGLSLSPAALKKEMIAVKENFKKAGLKPENYPPFGVDLALPQIGGNARKTNHDYTHGHLPELCDVIIEHGAKLFISAVGVPPAWMVEKLHKNNILYANMVGAPHHAEKAIASGSDLIIAQGYEGGGHTGDIGTIVLMRQVMRLIQERKYTSPLTGKPVMVVAAGGIADGQALAAVLALGAQGAWIGTRFICAEESGANDRYRNSLMKATALDTIRTLVVSGRPLRTLNTDYIKSWEVDRKDQIQALCDKGIVPMQYDIKKAEEEGKTISLATMFPLLMGQAAGHVRSVKPAAAIVEEIVMEAIVALRSNSSKISKL
jgi:NAD(P)H-dependent flavin oxidoreductase YrpB (nitropropane dioxygenase family)